MVRQRDCPDNGGVYASSDDDNAWSDERIALLSILGMWSVLFMLRVLRVIIVGQVAVLPASEQTGFIFSTGALLSWPLYLLLHRLRLEPIVVRLAIAATLSAALASMLALFSFCIWYHVPPMCMFTPGASHSITLRVHFARSFNELFLMFVGWASIYSSVTSALYGRLAEKRAARIAIEKRDAELTALRCQLDPHFLHNALNSISALVMRGYGAAADAEAAIDLLSSYLRLALTENGDGDASLAEEVERERLYLAIEKVRFGRRLTVRWHIPPELSEARMPVLLLQPAVENVVRHAVERTDRTVTMDVRAFASGGQLHLIVEDDGPGRSDSAGHGIGLQNVRMRLATRYDGRGSFKCGPRETGGFRTELVVPLEAHG